MRSIDELDHYELLEIKRNASSGEIDRAYRVAQQTYAEGSLALYSLFERSDAASIRLSFDEAYRVLSDPELRSVYDRELPPEDLERAAWRAGASGVPGASLRATFAGEGAMDAAEALSGFDPVEQLATLDGAVEEYDAVEDDGRGEFDGVRLRRNRLFRGYELDQISDVTKVNTSHLRNIEEENFGELPADVYVRGFVTAYARTIGLDPKIVVPSYMARVQDSRASNERGGFLGRR